LKAQIPKNIPRGQQPLGVSKYVAGQKKDAKRPRYKKINRKKSGGGSINTPATQLQGRRQANPGAKQKKCRRENPKGKKPGTDRSRLKKEGN